MSELEEQLLDEAGFLVACVNPFELAEKDGEGYATGWCADYILMNLKVEYEVKQDNLKWKGTLKVYEDEAS